MSHSPPLSGSPRALAAAVLVERPLLAVAVREPLTTTPTATPGLVIATAASHRPPLSASPPIRSRTAAAAVVVAAWEPPTKRTKTLHQPLHSTWGLDASTAAFEWSTGNRSPLSGSSSSSSLSTASLPPPHSSSPALDRRSSLPSLRGASPLPVTSRRVPPRQSSAPLQSRSLIPAGSLANLHLRLQQHPAIQRIQRMGAEEEEAESETDEDDNTTEDLQGVHDLPQAIKEEEEEVSEAADRAEPLPVGLSSPSFGRSTASPSIYAPPHHRLEDVAACHPPPPPSPLPLLPPSASSYTRDCTPDTSGFLSCPPQSHDPSPGAWAGVLCEDSQWDDDLPPVTSPSLTNFSTSGGSDSSASAGGEEEEEPWQGWLNLDMKGSFTRLV